MITIHTSHTPDPADAYKLLRLLLYRHNHIPDLGPGRSRFKGGGDEVTPPVLAGRLTSGTHPHPIRRSATSESTDRLHRFTSHLRLPPLPPTGSILRISDPLFGHYVLFIYTCTQGCPRVSQHEDGQ